MPEMIKPSDVTKEDLIGSPLRCSEYETIAKNILALSRVANNDTWTPFTWDEYVAFCTHTAEPSELRILDKFVELGYLRKSSDGKYGFQRRLVAIYMMYAENVPVEITDDSTIGKVRQFLALCEKTMKIFESDTSWEVKYRLIFAISGEMRALDNRKFSPEYCDPDTSYEEDVRAYVRALKELMTDYQKVIVALDT